VSDKYNSLVDAVASGPQPYGERLAGCAATDGFFLRRSKAEIGAEFPPSEQARPAPLGLCCAAGVEHKPSWASCSKLLTNQLIHQPTNQPPTNQTIT
jgi:hypothetical protein